MKFCKDEFKVGFYVFKQEMITLIETTSLIPGYCGSKPRDMFVLLLFLCIHILFVSLCDNLVKLVFSAMVFERHDVYTIFIIRGHNYPETPIFVSRLSVHN